MDANAKKMIAYIQQLKTTIIDKNPYPIFTTIGPGQAPLKAHPNPKIVPPIRYLHF